MIAAASRVGVLALQGGFDAHARMLRAVGAEVSKVRVAGDLERLDGLVLPGGESTTMSLAIERERLAGPLCALIADGTPVLATCAGLILLGSEHLGMLDIVVERNAFGTQVRSFEADLVLPGIGGAPLRAVFIRAPWIARVGAGVEVLAAVDGHPVAVRAGAITAVAFHPELTNDHRLHAAFADEAATWRRQRARIDERPDHPPIGG